MRIPTIEESHRALKQANNVRRRRQDIVSDLAAGRLDPEEVVRNPPAELASMFVFDFLFEVPHIGRAKVRDLNKAAVEQRINLAVSLGELTPLRREWLAKKLREWRSRQEVRRRYDRRRTVLQHRPQG